MNIARIRGREIVKRTVVFHSILSRLRAGTLFAVAFLLVIGGYAVLETSAHSAGITGYTQKSTNVGCYCHCSSASGGTTVSITTNATTFYTGQTYQFTATVSNSGESAAGIDIATEFGTLSAISGQGLWLSSGELTHSAPKSLAASWNFNWTAPSSPTYDTIFATGNAVNGDGANDGGNCTDNWNFAPKYIIHVVPAQTMRLAFGRGSILLGSVRVGHRVADSLLVRSTGTGALTINSSAMKSGAQFSRYPSTTNRTLDAGTIEVDSAIFAPTARGTFNDSLIFSTNSDTLPEQRTGVSVSGQGIQAIFAATNGTSLSFGNLRVGRTATDTFHYSNSGDDTLFLQAPRISGNGFSIVSGGTADTLPPNQTRSVAVQLAPDAKQSYSGTLSFTASDEVTTPAVSLSGNGTLPQIQVLSRQNLGQIRTGLTLAGTATFQNTGNDTLHISNATLTQLSTEFSLGAYDQAVAPGAIGTIHISYTADSETTDTATLHFITDDPSDSTVAVTLTAAGTAPHMAITENSDTLDLGEVKVNSSVTHDIAVTDNGMAILTLTNVAAGPAPFGIAANPVIVGAEGTAYVTVSFAPLTVGTFSGMLVIQSDDPQNPSDTVYLSGQGINSSLTISPASVAFGSISVSTTAVDTIELSNTGSASLNINGYELSPASGSFTVVDSSAHRVSAGDSVSVIVSFHPDTSGSYSGTLTLLTDDGGAPERTIDLSGYGVKGALSLSASSLDFGSVLVGRDSAMRLMLRNSGQASVTLSSINFTGPGASAFNDGAFSTPSSLTAGDSIALTLTFTPSASQLYEGMVQFMLGDGTDVAIPIKGAGASAEVSSPNFGSEALSFSITPNPAANFVTIHSTAENASETHLDVFDASGHEVLHKSLGMLPAGEHDVALPLTTLVNGSYFVRMRNGNGDWAQRSLILEK